MSLWEKIRVLLPNFNGRKQLNALVFEVTNDDINLILEKEKSLYKTYVESVDPGNDEIRKKARENAIKLVKKLTWLEDSPRTCLKTNY